MGAKGTGFDPGGAIRLTACAFIWGTAFVAQSVGSESLGPLTFNFSRTLLGAAFLAACCLATGRAQALREGAARRELLRCGLPCGLALSLAIFFQQLGIASTGVGRGGFITSLYIIFVPALNRIFFRRRLRAPELCGVLLASFGMYLICVGESLSVSAGDLFMLLAALFFAAQIVCVGRMAPEADSLSLSFAQFAVCAASSGFFMLLFEDPSLDAVLSCRGSVAYAGILSNGVAYTLQISGQKRVGALLASMLMSLESVFALASGWLLLGQALSLREISGCLAVFSAIAVAQLPEGRFRPERRER